ncbi:MAG: hypothetical protein COW88_00680 [Candidatus Lloydbacteria bacterium CG22_combo_CG10-13_8_21_14_all_47_15]|uniref:Uncharacterized protein n=1 Tax=Candidatus Lloydbacteria bacterium CG22_combo_CG10-13_8_21_14_all_47_15 TaxID=1974635 RepID=A0A2H0CV97_9BACT|nr:MAG: hypothetical protein COW88_00680 [Candidatus Lloydbacteria bacterium CG22_combo_CG10-13_8_21_14_all_47_15]
MPWPKGNSLLEVKARELYGWACEIVRQEYPDYNETQIRNEVALRITNAIRNAGGPQLYFQNQEY